MEEKERDDHERGEDHDVRKFEVVVREVDVRAVHRQRQGVQADKSMVKIEEGSLVTQAVAVNAGI